MHKLFATKIAIEGPDDLPDAFTDDLDAEFDDARNALIGAVEAAIARLITEHGVELTEAVMVTTEDV